MTTQVQDLADPIWTILSTIPHLNAYDGELLDATGSPVQPPADDDGRVHAYAVYYPGPGWAHALLACGGTDSLDWTFQVTCAAGDRTRTLWAIGQVRAALTGQRITSGGQALLITEVGNPGPLRRDDGVSPSRMFAPLTFAINA